MNVVRVLIANKTRLMRELVLATISDQPDIEVVGHVHDDTEIDDAIARTQPDFLIVTLEESDRLPDACRVLLERNPRLKMIAIASNRDSTICYWASLDIRSNRIESSEESVLSALRGKVSLTEG